jgi:hypothetical protein
MLRLGMAFAAAVLLVAGCAHSDREAAAPVQREIVKVEKTRTCTTTIRPDPAFCPAEKFCPAIKTCGEAYYRYTACREIERDGGTAGERNGIPCQNLCGETALTMADAIRAQSFSPPTRSETVCRPPAWSGALVCCPARLLVSSVAVRWNGSGSQR